MNWKNPNQEEKSLSQICGFSNYPLVDFVSFMKTISTLNKLFSTKLLIWKIKYHEVKQKWGK